MFVFFIENYICLCTKRYFFVFNLLKAKFFCKINLTRTQKRIKQCEKKAFSELKTLSDLVAQENNGEDLYSQQNQE